MLLLTGGRCQQQALEPKAFAHKVVGSKYSAHTVTLYCGDGITARSASNPLTLIAQQGQLRGKHKDRTHAAQV